MRDEGTNATGEDDQPEDVDWSAPLIAGRYRLGAELGQGAMADVFRATDLRLHREVAIKLFRPGHDAQVRSRFGAEAMALARLAHPGLVAIYDAGIDVVHADRPYLVMQLVDGESLRDRLLAGPMLAERVVALGAVLAAALAHVHEHGVVHRDVKPSNIVLDAEDRPYLADFGIALLVDGARMTGSNEILGTAAYLAPEQILGAEVGAPCDVYSLGLVLLECLTGVLEYPGVSKVESALARLHRPPRIPDGLPAGFADLLTELTANEPESRPTAAECADRLAAIAAQDLPAPRRRRAVAAVTAGAAVAKPARSGWRPYVIAGSSLVAAATAATWLLTILLPQFQPNTANGGPGQPPGIAGAPSISDGHQAGPAQLPDDAALTHPQPGSDPSRGRTGSVTLTSSPSAPPTSGADNQVSLADQPSTPGRTNQTGGTSTTKPARPPHHPIGGGGGNGGGGNGGNGNSGGPSNGPTTTPTTGGATSPQQAPTDPRRSRG